jgi:hypothetical protein
MRRVSRPDWVSWLGSPRGWVFSTLYGLVLGYWGEGLYEESFPSRLGFITFGYTFSWLGFITRVLTLSLFTTAFRGGLCVGYLNIVRRLDDRIVECVRHIELCEDKDVIEDRDFELRRLQDLGRRKSVEIYKQNRASLYSSNGWFMVLKTILLQQRTFLFRSILGRSSGRNWKPKIR